MKKTGLIFSLVVVGLILIFVGWFYQRRMSSHQIEQTSRDNQQDDISLAWHQSPPATTTTATTATTATAGEVLRVGSIVFSIERRPTMHKAVPVNKNT